MAVSRSIGRKALLLLTTIVPPDTILRWHWELAANKSDSSEKRKPGRPYIHQAVIHAIVRFARANPTLGDARIQKALRHISATATDCTTVEVWMRNGLVTFYVLTVMHLKTRRIHIAKITPSPSARWMNQICRNPTDTEDGFRNGASNLIIDRDTSIIAMRDFLQQNTDTEVLLLPLKSPKLNACMERSLL